MKSDGLAKPLVVTAILALIVYAVSYAGIEHRRTRKGPWRVTFSHDAAGAPALLINQPALGITNVQITFPEAGPTTNTQAITLAFAEPRPTPYNIPFGRCLFMDTTFLPGTIVLDLCGHEIQLIPRVLTVDRQEQPWRSEAIIAVTPRTNTSARSR